MRHLNRATATTWIVMAVIALGFAGGSLFAGHKDRQVIIEKTATTGGEKPWLGVYIGDMELGGMDRGDQNLRGIRILSVIDDSPAQKAGLKDGDLIIAFNGIDIENEDDFFNEFHILQPDDPVDVVVLRDGKEKDFNVVLGRQTDSPILKKMIRIPPIHLPEMRKRGYLGVNLQDMTDDLREYFDVPKGEGILVSKVEKDSPAEDAGLRAGDVITEAGGEVIRNPGDLIKALRNKEEGDQLAITFYRDGRRDNVTVTVDETENQVLDMSTLIWCDENDKDSQDCEGTLAFGPEGSYTFDFDSDAFQESMHKLQDYFTSEDFQRMIEDYSRTYQSREKELEKKMQLLEKKIQELEQRLQEMREKEEARKNRLDKKKQLEYRTQVRSTRQI